MSIKVITTGLLSSIQDSGRFGLQRIGMSPAGAMDLHSLRLANILADNPMDEAGIEMTMLGASLQFRRACAFALAGADMGAALDGVPVPVGKAVAANEGSVLRMGGARTGCRCYLAVNGGFALPANNGSKSTLLRSHIGGFQGRALKAGDEIPLAAPAYDIPRLPQRAICPGPLPAMPVEVRVILGPQEDYFSEEGIRTFLSSTYALDPKSDRMDCRFTGPKVTHSRGSNIISDGIPLGAVQIPGSGEPIVMMSEHQGAGGYPKIANVNSADLHQLAQCRPGDTVRFRAVSVEEGQRLYIARQEEYRRLIRKFRYAEREDLYQVSLSGRTYRVRIIPDQRSTNS